MRLGKVLLALGVVAFALLLMSALVVYAPAEADTALPAPVVMRVELIPLAMPAADAAAPTRAEPVTRLPALLAALVAVCAPLAPARRDANGRVLCARRYENSFYPVFRPEIAGG